MIMCVSIYLCVSMHVCMCILVYVCVWVYTYMSVCTCRCSVYLCLHVCVRLCVTAFRTRSYDPNSVTGDPDSFVVDRYIGDSKTDPWDDP